MTLLDDQLLLIGIVGDDGCPTSARNHASVLVRLLPTDDLQRELELNGFYDRFIDDLDLLLDAPRSDLCKCLALGSFLRFYADRDVRAEWQLIEDDYRTEVHSSGHPSDRLLADLLSDPSEILVPRRYSWLIPTANIAGLDGAATQDYLRLRHADPPYVILLLPLTLAAGSDLLVREPTGLDTIPTRDLVWRRGAVPGERIDRDIRRASCGGTEWRP